MYKFLLFFIGFASIHCKKTKHTKITPFLKRKDGRLFKTYKSFNILSIKGQLSSKIEFLLKTKYWKSVTPVDNFIKIEYEIFEFLDFLYIKVTLKSKDIFHSFSLKHNYSNKSDWFHDYSLIEALAKEIHYQSQYLINA